MEGIPIGVRGWASAPVGLPSDGPLGGLGAVCAAISGRVVEVAPIAL
jgi:hypothetical protein